MLFVVISCFCVICVLFLKKSIQMTQKILICTENLEAAKYFFCFGKHIIGKIEMCYKPDSLG
jgi:hypothetical protein